MKKIIKQFLKQEKGLTRSKIIKKLDKLVSDEVKRRAMGQCARCGGFKNNMGASHYFNRDYMGTRFLLENLDWLCWLPCHVRWEKRKHTEYRDHMVDKLGEKDLRVLEIKARAITKFSLSDLQFLLQEFEKGNFV